MNIAYLLTGGNVGDREKNLAITREKISERCGNIESASSIYETEAWGIVTQPTFLNQALKVKTLLSEAGLIQEILKIEKDLGRIRERKYGPRIIDVDILLFNNEVVTLPGLTIPHPELHNRRFALKCLNEIASGHIHPVLHKTIHELLTACTDPLKVYKFQNQ